MFPIMFEIHFWSEIHEIPKKPRGVFWRPRVVFSRPRGGFGRPGPPQVSGAWTMLGVSLPSRTFSSSTLMDGEKAIAMQHYDQWDDESLLAELKSLEDSLNPLARAGVSTSIP